MQTNTPADPAEEKEPIIAEGTVAIGVMHSEGGFIFDRDYYFDPEHRWKQDQKIARWCEEQYAPHPIYNAEAHLVQLDHQPVAFRQIGGLQPNLILGAAVGADFIFYGHQDPDISPCPLLDFGGMEGIAELDQIRWEEREPIATFLRQIDEFKRKYRNRQIDVFPPFFWDRSGRATVHGPLTTAHKLMGENFFMLLQDDFEMAYAFLQWIAKAYTDLIMLFSQRAELPVTGVHIGECSGCLFSADLWARAAIPAINTLSEACGPVRLHSCGKSDHLLELLTGVRNLQNFNLGSATNIARSRELLGLDMALDVIPDQKLLSCGSLEQTESWVGESLAENSGGPMAIQLHLDAGVPLANALAVFKALESHGIKVGYESLVERWRI